MKASHWYIRRTENDGQRDRGSLLSSSISHDQCLIKWPPMNSCQGQQQWLVWPRWVTIPHHQNYVYTAHTRHSLGLLALFHTIYSLWQSLYSYIPSNTTLLSLSSKEEVSSFLQKSVIFNFLMWNNAQKTLQLIIPYLWRNS